MSGNPRICPVNSQFWPDIVRWPAVICSPGTYWKGANPAVFPAAVGTKLWANCWMPSLWSRFQNSCPGLYRLWSSYEWEPLSQSGKFDRKPGFMTSRDKTTQVFEMKSEMWSDDFFKVQWIDCQSGQKKNIECLLFVKSPAPRQDDGIFEDLSPWTSFCPGRDK